MSLRSAKSSGIHRAYAPACKNWRQAKQRCSLFFLFVFLLRSQVLFLHYSFPGLIDYLFLVVLSFWMLKAIQIAQINQGFVLLRSVEDLVLRGLLGFLVCLFVCLFVCFAGGNPLLLSAPHPPVPSTWGQNQVLLDQASFSEGWADFPLYRLDTGWSPLSGSPRPPWTGRMVTHLCRTFQEMPPCIIP